jgi:hypothetical protein
MADRAAARIARTGGLALLGVVTWWVSTAVEAGLTGPTVAIAVAVVILGGVEVLTIRATGRQRPVAAWLPTALGFAAAVAVAIATGPVGPDSGVATSIAVAIVLVATGAMATGVHLLAGIARVLGVRARPESSSGPRPAVSCRSPRAPSDSPPAPGPARPR